MLDPRTTIARTVLDHAETASVFQRHRIDFCCKGNRSITEACAERGVDEAVVLADLEQAIADREGLSPASPSAMSTPALIAHIISTHHAYLRRTLPFVRGLAAKVGRVHGEREPQLVTLAALVVELEATLTPHLDAEEGVLFHAMLAANAGAAGVNAMADDLVAMKQEHEAVGALLEQIRSAADGYHAPEWACTSYRTLFAELDQLEGDILRHVHLENHVLAPRFGA
jgi:regulator of cell morphogenesis and NO signaling